MTVHVKMLLKDGVSFRLLTAVDPVNIQVIASDPDLNNLPVLSISNPPSRHVIANDAWIMNEKGDTISKIDYKALIKAGTPEPIKPITHAEKTVDVIAGTPIFKPEKMEEQHRGAEFGAFIGMDFYPFYCIAPSLVREYGVYASDEIIEQLRKTRLVSHVFLSLLKENSEKYNPEMQTITVTDASVTVKKTLVLDPPDSGKLFESVLSPASIDVLKDQLKQNTDIALVIINSPGIIDNLMSSVFVIEQSQGKYTCTVHYPGMISDPKEFSAEQLKSFIGNDEYTIFTVTRDEIFTKLTLLPHIQSQPDGSLKKDYYETALARKRFYDAHPQFKEVLSAGQMSVLGIVDALRESSVSIKTVANTPENFPGESIHPSAWGNGDENDLAVQGLLAEDTQAKSTPNTDQMKQVLYDQLVTIPSSIADHLDESGLEKFKAFVVDHVKGLLRADVRVTTTPGAGSYTNTVKISTAQHMIEFPSMVTPLGKTDCYPPQTQTIWNVYRLEGEFAFSLVEEN